MSHSLDTSRLKEVSEALEDNTERLTDWERGFVESVADQYEHFACPQCHRVWGRRRPASER